MAPTAPAGFLSCREALEEMARRLLSEKWAKFALTAEDRQFIENQLPSRWPSPGNWNDADRLRSIRERELLQETLLEDALLLLRRAVDEDRLPAYVWTQKKRITRPHQLDAEEAGFAIRQIRTSGYLKALSGKRSVDAWIVFDENELGRHLESHRKAGLPSSLASQGEPRNPEGPRSANHRPGRLGGRPRKPEWNDVLVYICKLIHKGEYGDNVTEFRKRILEHFADTSLDERELERHAGRVWDEVLSPRKGK